jgi:hypothetical protein
MMEDRAIERIDLVNNTTAEVYLKAEVKEEERYKDASGGGISGSRYDYYLPVGDAAVFTGWMTEAQETLEIPFRDRTPRKLRSPTELPRRCPCSGCFPWRSLPSSGLSSCGD